MRTSKWVRHQQIKNLSFFEITEEHLFLIFTWYMFDNFHKNKWPHLKVTQASHQKCLYKTKILLTQDHTYKIVLGSSTGKDSFPIMIVKFAAIYLLPQFIFFLLSNYQLNFFHFFSLPGAVVFKLHLLRMYPKANSSWDISPIRKWCWYYLVTKTEFV